MRRLLSLAPVLGLLALGCGGSGYEAESITVYTQDVERVVVDETAEGPSAADTETYFAELFTQPVDGDSVGQLEGVATIVRTQTIRGQKIGRRMGTLQFSFDGLGTVVASGIYPAEIPGDAKVPANQLVRPIVGGTDAYANARGRVVQTPIADGQQKITLIVETPTEPAAESE